MGETSASATRTNVKPLAALTPMAHVADVALSISWYAKLGFVAEHTLTLEGRPIEWAHLRNGGRELMIVRSDRAMNPGAQDTLFYLYADRVAAYRESLIAQGLRPGEMTYPPYAKHGEFRIDDPDGYCLLVGDKEQQ